MNDGMSHRYRIAITGVDINGTVCPHCHASWTTHSSLKFIASDTCDDSSRPPYAAGDEFYAHTAVCGWLDGSYNMMPLLKGHVSHLQCAACNTELANMPEVTVYHYENDGEPQPPWWENEDEDERQEWEEEWDEADAFLEKCRAIMRDKGVGDIELLRSAMHFINEMGFGHAHFLDELRSLRWFNSSKV